jgi:hypothetical protein
MSPPPLCSLEGCFHDRQDQEGSFSSWLKLLFFSGLDQHIIAKLVWVNGKVKWRILG